MSQHQATFTWGAGPNRVHISGGFNNWSANASPLHKQADGTFKGEIALPWGEKQAFKYVVDGEWKVREDEAKEWDAAGNMNNVYTAPHAPAAESKPEPVVAASAAPTSQHQGAPVPVEVAKSEPSHLLAASAPAATSAPVTSSAHGAQLDGFALGAPISGNSITIPAVSQPTTASLGPSAPPTVALPPTPATTSTAETIEKTAAKANVGEAATGPHEEGILEKATAIGATALAGIGAYVASAAVAVEKATGVDLTHGQPAKAAGVDLNRIEKRDGPTDTVSPVGTKPSSAAIDDLNSKVQDLKIGSASTAPKAEQHANDIPAQADQKDNHKTVPMPVITAISDKDPKKDRSLESNTPAVGAKPIDTDPSISAKVAKVEAESNPSKTGATLDQANGTASKPIAGPAATGPIATGAVVSPSTPAANIPAAPQKQATPVVQPTPVAKESTPAVVAKKETTPATTTSTPVIAPVPPLAPAKVAAAPATPTKSTTATQNGTPSSIQTTPASTPVKSAHGKEATSGSDVRKRKSSFFHKIKSAFSPKDKEKK